ncbi:MAG: HTTM domain-containing protein, partial [Microthrixaceae bacterium]
VAFTWVEFIESTIYLNHYWFMTLAGATMLVLPVCARWSLDTLRKGPQRVPRLAVWILRFQVATVYVFAGIAKLNGDWLNGLPLGLWLPASSGLWLVGDALTWRSTALVASWAGALFDCTVVGFLLWKRTRIFAWLVVVGFHVTTWVLLPVIGVFPALMIPMSTIMFDPGWPSELRDRLRRFTTTGHAPGPELAVAPLPVAQSPIRQRGRTRWVTAAILLWAGTQVALPLRHHLYPGDHRWSGEAFRFGWNVMLVEKAGDVVFTVTDPATGRSWRDDARSIYTPQQWRVMSTEPELIRQAAHEVAVEAGSTPAHHLEVRADARMSLNGRPSQRLIDPEVDLAAEPWRLGPQPWILEVPRTQRPR